MWHLTSISAKNLCSFLELSYAPKRGAVTLIFGNNLDSDSQNSNGSGKSALIEAIAIGLTGEPLRKVNIDEIINDSQNEAVVALGLSNDVLGKQMTIKRCLSRKQPQLIQIVNQTGPYDTDTEEIHQASVADYNKYILDQLGLTKEDIFANFILTARKYKSFLSSSDKEKKEIINRFSNGVLVDESIEKLREDMEPVRKEMDAADKEVATCTGRVEALANEIEKAINESAQRNATNKSRIQNWEQLITEKRGNIRTANENIAQIEESLDGLDDLDAEMQKLEKGDSDADDSLQQIMERFKANNLALTIDFVREIEVLNSSLESAQKAAKEVSENVDEVRKSLQKSEEEYSSTSKSLQAEQATNEKNREKCAERIKKLGSAVKRLQENSDRLASEQRSKKHQKSELDNQLAGVIQCPKCKHEFTLGADLNIAYARKSLATVVDELDQIAKDIEANDNEYNKTVADGKNQREIETALEKERRQIANGIREAEDAIREARQQCAQYEKKIEDINARLAELQGKLSKIRKRIFDETFEIIDEAYKRRENQIKSLEEDIKALEGSIESYEKAINDARKVSEEDLMTSLRESKDQYQKTLEVALAKKNEVEGRLKALETQEATFIEFKTYLANTKISAIAQITNEFLETIGSDIRIALSGYTILKSGKVRDKISVSLLRDGVDCGSFEKFSAGERVRVELASILSMNQLTNLNCEEGKGLDLLIADEVLDSADEQGLASVFNALNKTQITSLVVSHGQVHEGYPNKITVTKSNGVSSIYGNESTN